MFIFFSQKKTLPVSGTIIAVEVLSTKGSKYVMESNTNYQPLRKGGWVLVKFLSYLARMGDYCPIGALTWPNVANHLKVKIIDKMRVSTCLLAIKFSLLSKDAGSNLFVSCKEHFVIPKEEVNNTLALQRVDRFWRHYKYELKKAYFKFKPEKKTQVQHYDPHLSKIGKEARSLQCQAHIMGSNSYANLRADYEEHGEEMSLIECCERSHVREDGT
ncbi:putative elongation factor 1-delta, partial [Bienertia sinuspersici]